MTADEILADFDRQLEFMFPDEPHPNCSFWQQRSYRDELFDLCIKAYDIVRRDDLAQHCRGVWSLRRQHKPPKDMERQMNEIVDAWGEWQYAYQRLEIEK
ncbi:hypothetical protein [Anatilimnocola floriformis]|uniref:hypothetical protein n=1 Tax=Anatilimnocola floriformis TaxID=2948575 RepID=UPI0020C23405|nr:hypothetical protein [Anatilimnocola floriformis]